MIVALIPARGGSKRVPGKNLADLNGVPLLVWSITCALVLKLPTYVSTEDAEIADIAKRFGATVIVRPPELAEDLVLDLPVIRHAIKDILIETVRAINLVVYLRPTTPFRKVSVVQAAIDEIKQAGDKVTGLRSVQPLEEPPIKCFLRINGLLQPYFTWTHTELSSQKCLQVQKPNGYVDICRPEVVLSDEGPWGRTVIGFKTPPTIEIDEPHHLEWARALASSQQLPTEQEALPFGR